MVESRANHSLRYRKDIDGVRAIAVLSVVFYHCGSSLFSGGFTGVDIFFAISGYLIGGQIFREIYAGSFSYIAFYFRRAKRILPAYYFVLCFSILAAMALLAPQEAIPFSSSSLASALSASNFYFFISSNYFSVKNELKPLLMTWSLGVEEQFYFVIPFFMILISKIHRRWSIAWVVAISAASFTYACATLTTHPESVFYLLPARAWELGAGVLLAIVEFYGGTRWMGKPIREIAGWTGMALLLTPVFFYSRSTPFPGLDALPCVLGATLVLAARDNWINRKILSLPPMTYVGRISYSLYLWHWPLLSFLRIITGQPSGLLISAAVLLAFLLSVVSYHFIEQPFRHTRTFPLRSLFKYAAITILLSLVSGSIFLARGLPRRYPNVAKAQIYEGNPCLVGYEAVQPNTASQCTHEDPSRPTVVLWGDSHASALAPALREKAAGRGMNFVQYTKTSCLPLIGVAKMVGSNTQYFRACIDFNRQVLQKILNDRSITTVVMAGILGQGFLGKDSVPILDSSSDGKLGGVAHDPHTVLFAALSATVAQLQQAGKHVVLVGDAPWFAINVSQRYFTHNIPLREAIYRLLLYPHADDSEVAENTFAQANQEALGVLSQVRNAFPNVSLVNLEDTLCPEAGSCYYMSKDVLFFLDEQHLTADGSRFALRDFELP